MFTYFCRTIGRSGNTIWRGIVFTIVRRAVDGGSHGTALVTYEIFVKIFRFFFFARLITMKSMTNNSLQGTPYISGYGTRENVISYSRHPLLEM